MSPLLVILVVTVLILAVIISRPWRRRMQRRRIAGRPFPDAWRKVLRARLPWFLTMPADLQLQLKGHIQVFLEEKNFIGCAGLEVDDDIRVTIAAQACLLLLNRHTDYFPQLRSVLVYPAAFIANRPEQDETGVLHHRNRTLLGESWSHGQVIVSWQDAVAGAADYGDGTNVVIHEFAHQLDQETGSANGVPYLGRKGDYQRWSSVLGQAFEELQTQAARGEDSLLDPYGATNPAEFFAVASEVFFEQALALNQQYPELYRELSAYYRVNPLSWR